MKTAIVLSGGGAKGAYQMGVWKALKKLHIKYDIVTGTSVGAINGVFMVQKNFYKALKIWSNISYKDVFGDEFEKELNNENEKEVYKKYAKNFFEDGGMTIDALENLFSSNISLFRFKRSKIDYGMVTFNLTDLKPQEMVKKDLLNDNLKEYVLASASCYPAFKTKMIDNKNYIDGGYYDNLPINLAIKMGADKIIAVDLKAPGLKKPIGNKEVDIIRIYPRNKIVSFLVFDKDLSKRAINLGYNDTMKTFNKLDGNKYTFKKEELKKNYFKYREEFIKTTQLLSHQDSLLLSAIISFNDINNILKEKDFSKLHNDIIEYLGKIFELDEAPIYTMKEFNRILQEKFLEVEEITKLTERVMLDSKLIMSYIYYLLDNNKINVKNVIKVMLMYKKEFMGALYMIAIKG